MPDFVGMNPEKVQSLLQSVQSLNERVAVLRTQLARCVDAAGSELAPGGERGPAIFERYLSFLDEEHRNIQWRLRVLTSGGTRGPDGQITAEVGFGSERQARNRGQTDGRDAVNSWYEQVVVDGDWEGWIEHVNEMILTGQLDPAYATEFFLAIGDTLVGRPGILSGALDRYAGSDHYLDDEELRRAREELGPLFTMLGVALTDGSLPESYRDELLAADPRYLSLMIDLAPGAFPPDFMSEAVQTILAGNDYEAKMRALQALGENPEAARRFLQDPDNIEAMSRYIVGETDGSGRGEDYIARILQVGLSDTEHPPLGGATDPEIAAAWSGVMTALENPDLRRLIGRRPELAQTLATAIKPYLPFLASRQGDETTAHVTIPMPDGHAPEATTQDAINLFATIVTDPGAREILMEDYQEYVQSLGMGGENPFDSDASQKEFTEDVARAGGMASLIIAGLSQSGLDTEELRDSVGRMIMAPIEAALRSVRGIGSLANAAWEATGNKEDVQRWLGELVSGDPARASDAVDGLVSAQMAAIQEAAEEQGTDLDSYDLQNIEDIIRGRLSDALVNALAAREG